MAPNPCVVLLGTCDTKLQELLFLHSHLTRHVVNVMFIDIGWTHTKHYTITFSHKRLLRDYGDEINVTGLSRQELKAVMASCATRAVKELYLRKDAHAIIATGGTWATEVAAQVMRDAVPIGFPKLIVTTMANRDMRSILGETDITIMHSAVDICGRNQLVQHILSNAGAAISAMAHAYTSRVYENEYSGKKRVAITASDFTVPAVDLIRQCLVTSHSVETFIFQADGHGGRAMERLIREGGLDAVVDLTLTEVSDYITGGTKSAGGGRLEAAAEVGLPQIVCAGATDMITCGPLATMPEHLKQRGLYECDSKVTLVRTSSQEAQQVGVYIAQKLKTCSRDTSVVEVWLPTGGVSTMSVPGGDFADPEADAAMIQEVTNGLAGTGIRVVAHTHAINDEAFACDVAQALMTKLTYKPAT